MARTTSGKGSVWAVVLAGGEGERVRPLVQRWLGYHRPKQYCTFTGTRSMFQHTVDRALELTSGDRIVAVASEAHRADVGAQLRGRPIRAALLQPENRDTAAGILLPLAYIRALDPDATVVLLPSDHFVQPEDRFLESVRRTIDAAWALPDRLVLLAVLPDRPETEYGWLEPDGELAHVAGRPVRAIGRFVEKPGAEQAVSCMAAGGLWNTLVLAARADTLWTLARHCFPEITARLETVRQEVARTGVAPRLEAAYEALPRQNFSSGLLARMPDRVAVVEADGFDWCDWGKPERIVTTLESAGHRPAFPVELVAGRRVAGSSALRAPAALGLLEV